MRVGIVGAGPAGLIAAITGARLGLNITLFEQAPQLQDIGSGFGIQSNGLRVLDALGILKGFLPKLHLCQKYVLTLNGTTSIAMDFSMLSIPHNKFAVALRYELQKYLVNVALKESIRLLLGYQCKGITISNYSATLYFANGHQETFDVVVACDGVHSAIRESLPVKVRKKKIPHAYLRGVAPLKILDKEFHEIWGKDGRIFGICPIPNQRTFFFCSAPLKDWNSIVENHLERWILSWKDYGEVVVNILKAVEDWQKVHYDNRLYEIQLKPWYHLPVFFVGDAAHAMMPNYGQGANSAMVDAFILMQCLAKVHKGQSTLTEAARAYDTLRRPFVTRIQQRSRNSGRMASWTSVFARTFRNHLIALTTKIPSLDKQNKLLAAGFNPKESPYFQPLS